MFASFAANTIFNRKIKPFIELCSILLNTEHMDLTTRHQQIMQLARTSGKVDANALAVEFKVAVQTIRRDLNGLCQLGHLERVHGGAVLPSGISNIGYSDRRLQNKDAKLAIAEKVAQRIPDNHSIFLNIGTTTEAVARALLNHTSLMVVTNNINVANILTTNASAQVIVAGGRLRRSDGGMTGDITSKVIRNFKVDTAIIGASSLDADGDILDFDPDEVRVSKAILDQSRRAVLVADASKFTRTAPVRIGSLADIDEFITDAQLSESLLNSCKNWGTTVTRVKV